MKLSHRKLPIIFGLLFCVILTIVTPMLISAVESEHSSPIFSINADVYKKIKDLEGALDDGPDEDLYTVYMEEGIEYSFRVEFNLAIIGAFGFYIQRPGESFGFAGVGDSWFSGDAGVEKVLNFTAIADTTGEHTLQVMNGGTGTAATYVLNFKPLTAGLEWWWYAVIGGGSLAILIIFISIISASSKSKKKKSKKKSKKKK